MAPPLSYCNPDNLDQLAQWGRKVRPEQQVRPEPMERKDPLDLQGLSDHKDPLDRSEQRD